MTYLFADKEIAQKMIKGAYKKFKSRIFYDKTLLFTKKKIAEFECDREIFLASLNSIAEALINSDYVFFEEYIKQIKFNVLPKRFESSEKPEIVYESIDHNQKLKSINFYIDMPIELHIVDFLWTLLIGKIMDSYILDFEHAAATQFKRGLFLQNESLENGVDFDSNRAFKPYFGLYSRWRNGAFNIINKKSKSNNLLLMCLDLKSFYYSVDFNFDDLKVLLHNDDRLDSIEFLTNIIRCIYCTYTDVIRQYKQGISTKLRSCVFPIGLDSTVVLREIYLSRFDRNLNTALNPLYYQRYVDDMLIVLNDDNENETNNDDVLSNNFVSTGLAYLRGKDLQFKDYPTLRVQKKKVNCFYFHKGQRAVLLDIYREVIKNSSEANLLPDMSILNASFTSTAYNVKNLDLSDKLRDLGIIVSNNYKATRYLSDFQRIIKNAVIDKDKIKAFFNQVEDFYQGSQCLEYSNNWRGLFELYFLCNEQVMGRAYYTRCKNLIKNIDFDSLDKGEVQKGQEDNVLNMLKTDLKEKLDISISLAGSLNYKSLKSTRLIEMAKQFRSVNLLNHKMVSYPLINYMNDENVPLTEINLSEFYRDRTISFDLDRFKLEWSPRFIHTIEFYIVDFLHTYSRGVIQRDPNEVLNRFFVYNNLNYKNDDISVEDLSTDHVKIYRTIVKKGETTEHRVAIVNTKVSEENILDYLDNPKAALSIRAKLSLFEILNKVKEGRAEFVIFPEFYLPIAWILDLADFCYKNNITVIAGLQYVTFKNVAFNNLCAITPYQLSRKYKIGLLQFREKNFYAPKEKIALSKKGYECCDKNMPLYFLNSINGYNYSSILCYEFTDIYSRAAMKSHVELLFVPQLNHDTNYFSAIVESAARDLHCFVVQANTSEYGDSRITAPYKTEEKNILQIKGGETDVVMIGTVDIKNLMDYRKKYDVVLKREILNCLNCKKTKKKSAKCYNVLCKDCKKSKYGDRKIKPLPPQF